MPIYEYRHTEKTAGCKEVFEIIAVSSQDGLKNCPKCGGPVEKIPSIFSGRANVLAPSNLKEKGFTKLVKDREKGGYRKVD